ncbi:RICIN domain-containing protein [Kitasatospora sp. NPDC127121]|uniref:RICIN domain-containing protein n=1 Tax=Kitasatospora sp. NPDC127121 TaxID=3345371 RepID=UPI003639031A
MADDAKPILGVKLADGTWYYSMHATNRATGFQERNNVPAAIQAVTATGDANWALMGDFNREPGSLSMAQVYGDGRRLVSSGMMTYPMKLPTSEFDYMIARGLPADHQYTARRLSYVEESDHYPVMFSKDPLRRKDETCRPIPPIRPRAAAASMISLAAAGVPADVPAGVPAGIPAGVPADSAPSTASASAATAREPQHGKVSVLTSGAAGLVADVPDASPAPGSPVRAAAPDCSAGQSWATWQKADDTWVIETGRTNGTTAAGQGSVLSVPAYGDRLAVRPIENDATSGKPDGSPGQRWRFVADGAGGYRITTATDGRCLTLDGNALTVAPCDGSDRQGWHLSVPCSGAGHTVPGFPDLPWPTVSDRPEVTWPSLPGHPAIPWPSVPGFPGVPMPGRPDLPELRWPGFPTLPTTAWPAISGHPEATWPAVPGSPTVPWPAMPGHPGVPWPVLPLPGNGNDDGKALIPGLPSAADPAIPGHPDLAWPTVPGFPQVKWPSVPGSPNVPWPGHPDLPDAPGTGGPSLPDVTWPTLPGSPLWRWPSVPGFPTVPWPSLPGLPDVPWPATTGFPNDPAAWSNPPKSPEEPPKCKRKDPPDGKTPGGDDGSTGGRPPVPAPPGISLPWFPALPMFPPIFGGPSTPSGPNGGTGPNSGTGPNGGSGNDAGAGAYLQPGTGDALVPDVRGSSTVAGNAVQAYEPNGTDAQKWVFWDRGNGNWSIETRLTYNRASAAERMLLAHDTGRHESVLAPAAADGQPGQLWQFKDAGGGWTNVVSAAGGCLTQRGAHEVLAVRDCDGSAQQKWKLSGTVPTAGGGNGNNGGSTGGGSTGGQPPLGAGGTQPAHNRTVVLQSGNGGLLADLDGANTAAGTRIKAQGRNGNDAQKWTLWQKPDSQWLIETKLGGGMVMDHNPTTHRTHLIGAQEGNANQLWRFADAGGGWFTVVSAAGNGCLTAAADGAELAILGCDGTNAQKWRLTEAVDNPSTGGGNGGTGGNSGGGGGNGGGGNSGDAGAVPVYSALPSKCLDVTAGNTANNTPIDLYDCNNTASQQWTPTATSGGLVLKAFGKCLDVAAGNTAGGTRVGLYDCNASAAQNWRQGADSSLVNPNSGKCLDVVAGNSANGTALQIWDCNASDAQRWGLGTVPPRAPQQPAQQPGTTPVVSPGVGSSQVATLRSANNTMVADLDGANTASGTSIKALGANGNNAQRWAFWPTANGRWIIETLLTDGKAAAGQGMVMDHDPGTHRAHLIRTMDGNANQHWAFHDAGGGWFWITSDADNGCLTADNAGEQLGIWACDGSDRQRWRLDNIQNGPTPGGGSSGGGAGGNTGGSSGGGGNTGGNNGGSTGGGSTGGGNAGSGGTPQAPGGSGVRHGVTTVLRSGNSGLVADLDGANTAGGTRIKAQGRNGSAAQQWMLWQKPNNQWLIETKFAGAMVMDHNPSTHRAHLTSAQEGNANQLWRFQESQSLPGWYRIVSAADNGCLTAVNGNEDLAVWACTSSTAQWWELDDSTFTGGGGGNTGGGGGGGSGTGGGGTGGGGGGNPGGGNTGGGNTGGGGGRDPRFPDGMQLPPVCNGRQSSGSWMWHGDTLCPGQSLESRAAEQSTRLVMQQDGNLVAYYTQGDAIGDHTWAVWESKTVGCGAKAVMQDDGNLVVTAADGRVCWASGTNGRNGAWLMVSPLGDIQILQAGDATGAAIDGARAVAAAGKGDFLEAFIYALQAIIKGVPKVQWQTNTGHPRLVPPKCVVTGGRVIPCT